MDPITQGALGAACVDATVGGRAGKRAWLIGALSGMAPDLDVLIKSSDPLVAVTYHRHFTHALAFVPIGGLLVALPFLWRERDRARWPWIVLAAIIGWATHAPLDCGTSYGTLYFWPFSDTRVALDFLPIIDPLYTVPLIVGVAVARRRADRRWLYGGLVLAHLYAVVCQVQHVRALKAFDAVLGARNDRSARVKALPLPLNITRWRGVALLEHGGGITSAYLHVPLVGEPTFVDGDHLEQVTADVPEGWPDDERSREATRVMRWFSQGFLVALPFEDDPAPMLCDARLSMDPTRTVPVMCVRRTRERLTQRPPGAGADPGRLVEALFGTLAGERPVRAAGDSAPAPPPE